MFLPLLGGEGWGEGEQDTRSFSRLRIRLGDWETREESHALESFIISSLGLYRRSLTVRVILSFTVKSFRHHLN
jgi:hypothetical protein